MINTLELLITASTVVEYTTQDDPKACLVPIPNGDVSFIDAAETKYTVKKEDLQRELTLIVDRSQYKQFDCKAVLEYINKVEGDEVSVFISPFLAGIIATILKSKSELK